MEGWKDANSGTPSADEDVPATGAALQGATQPEIKISTDTDYHSFERPGLTKDAIRNVLAYAESHGTLDISVDQIASKMTDIMGMPQSKDPLHIAGMVLSTWKKVNSCTASADSLAQLLQVDIPSDYHSFDCLGLTQDAIRIVWQYVEKHGTLDIAVAQVADTMTDFMGMKQPSEAPWIAKMVLKTWKAANCGSAGAAVHDAAAISDPS